MGFFFVKSGWDNELDSALRKDSSELRIVCPFIKRAAAARLLDRGNPKKLLVITRASLDDFYAGVSDTEALKLLLKAGGQIRVVRNLHTKLYIFGNARVILTSANLTEKALRANHEFGFVADSRKIVADCTLYFSELWTRARRDISIADLTRWQRQVSKHKAKAGGKPRPGLPDYGTEVDQDSEPSEPDLIESTDRAFVKFFGEGHNRSAHSSLIFDEVKRSGSHWALTYPKGRRPRSVRDGDIAFMGCLVEHPKDILIYGRAIATHYRRDTDDATPADIKKRSWKSRWPHYIRVHNPEFLNGPLSNGVSLKELMRTLRADSFAVTQRNAVRGKGNTEPRKSLMQQASVRLSILGTAWLTKKLEQAFEQYGKMSGRQLRELISYG